MEKNTLVIGKTEKETTNGTYKKLCGKLMKPVYLLGKYYSLMLERDINPKQTLALLNAQASFFCGVFIDAPVVLRVVFAGWFVYALYKCKKLL